MSEKTGLVDRARRLAQPVPLLKTGYRRLAGNAPESLLAALLCEIDETILPRRIKLITNRDQTAQLQVAGRRLMRVNRPNESVRADPSKTATAAELMGQLQSVFLGATKAALFNERAGSVLARSDSGYLVSALVEAASLESSRGPAHDPVPGLFTALGRQMTAFVTLDPAGNMLKQGGDKEWSDRIISLVRNGLEDLDAQMIQSLPGPDHPGCIMLSAGGSSGSMLLYARSQSAGFLAILPASAIKLAQAAWFSQAG